MTDCHRPQAEAAAESPLARIGVGGPQYRTRDDSLCFGNRLETLWREPK